MYGGARSLLDNEKLEQALVRLSASLRLERRASAGGLIILVYFILRFIVPRIIHDHDAYPTA